jgi:S-adenosylmethionine:tRNA ribosyltransferase-isomerase
MKIADFDFPLPEELIAERPLKDRSASKLLVLHRDGQIEHRTFSDLPSFLDKGDMLIMNNTKVFPARLTGLKKNGATLEILLVKQQSDSLWEILSKGQYTGTLKISDNLQAHIHKGSTAEFLYSGEFMDLLWKYGNMPLPPYIRRSPDTFDRETYQTVYAKKHGSIAAPTAGLHFTDTLLHTITARGIILRELTLHVGIGTFKPIRTEHIEEHVMETEYFEIDKKLIQEISATKKSGRRVIAVGTTTTRALEGCINNRCNHVSQNGNCRGTTDIFIYPGYTFNAIDALVTNFHIPRSTPLMLVSALCGRELLFKAYGEAVAGGYRFLSYGDAMLIL